METAATREPLALVGHAEEDLCRAATEARPARPKRAGRIRADVLRRLLLGLPLEGGPYRLTPAGIRLIGGTLEGRLDLENVAMPEGGPIAALELDGCVLEGGFSGAYGHFSRLSFAACRFRDLPPEPDGEPAPTVDLTGAVIESDLSMRGARPFRKRAYPDGRRDHLWIRAIGARIHGQIDLSQSHLRAPPEPPDRLMSAPSVDALNLSLANVSGDFQFLNAARSEGAITARRATIKGDVWMSGALLEGSERHALLFQSAEIGGLLMLDGRAADAARQGDCRPFRAFGQLNLNDLQLGGSLVLTNVDLRPPRPAAPARRRPARTGKRAGERKDDADSRAEAAAFACLRLDEARIGDSVVIDIFSGERSRLQGMLCLANAEIKNALIVSDAFLGMPVEDAAQVAVICAPFLTARQVTVSNVEPLLWEEGKAASGPNMMALSIHLGDAKVESLTVSDSWLTGCFWAASLKCTGDLGLDARVGGGVDLAGAEIGGSLDLSEMRLDSGAEGLNLQDATVEHTLRLTNESHAARDGAMRLVKARRATLYSLYPMQLVECLWSCDRSGDRTDFFQTGFVMAGDRSFLLDGKQASFDSLVGHFGHSIDEGAIGKRAPAERETVARAIAERAIAERDRAAEFVRLHRAYVRTGSGPGIMIADADGLPPFLDAARPADAAARAASGGSEGRAAPASRAELLAGIKPASLKPKPVRKKGEQGEFTVSGYCLHGSRLVRASFRLRTKTAPVKIKLLKEKLVRNVVGVPRVDHQFVCHPEDAQAAGRGQWVLPPAVDGMAPIEENELPALEAKLGHHVRTSCTIHGTADLTGLVCAMLDDNSGRSWGSDAIIPMNHFVYSRTTWIGKDAEDPAPFLKDLLRSARVELGRRLPLPLIKLFGWTPHLRRWSGYCSGWQARLDWIYRQYDTSDLPSPSRFRITQANYSPQPFEQAIKVCRAEGREDYALQFEVEKQKIEWRLRNRRNRVWLLALGLIAAGLWLALTGPDTEHRWPIATVLALGIAGISYAAGFALRYMFGYLRRPVRAIASLVAAFLIGWAGVHIANQRHLLVVDVEPVAGFINLDEKAAIIGSQREADTKNLATNIHCGPTISEGLYALDVLIPLIDLREENRCEVGRANDIEDLDPIRPEWAGTLFGWAIDSERFWAAAKAIYAIAGWFIVSLSILTFANTNRARAD